jgi:hypothetical protein
MNDNISRPFQSLEITLPFTMIPQTITANDSANVIDARNLRVPGVVESWTGDRYRLNHMLGPKRMAMAGQSWAVYD